MARKSFDMGPWLHACDRFTEDLTEHEKNLFRTASPESILSSSRAAQKHHETHTSSQHVAAKLQSFVAAIEQYGPAFDVYANAAAPILCPLWGSVRVLLNVSTVRLL